MSDLDFDDQGHIDLRYGETEFQILLTSSPTTIEFRAELIEGVRYSPEILAFVNDLNRRYGALRFTFHHDAIIATREIPAIPFIAEHVVRTMNQFGTMADGLGEFMRAMKERGTAPDGWLESTARH